MLLFVLAAVRESTAQEQQLRDNLSASGYKDTNSLKAVCFKFLVLKYLVFNLLQIVLYLERSQRCCFITSSFIIVFWAVLNTSACNTVFAL